MPHRPAKWYTDALDAMRDMVIIKGAGSRILWGNKRFRDAYGMSVDDMQDAIDAPHEDPDDSLQYVRDDRHVFETGATVAAIEPVTEVDGTRTLVATIKTPVLDEDGATVRTVGVSRFSDQEFAPNRDEERKAVIRTLRAAIKGLPLPTVMIDMQSRVTATSAGFDKIRQRPDSRTLRDALTMTSELSDSVEQVLSDGNAARVNGFVDAGTEHVFDVTIEEWTLPGRQRGGAMLVFNNITEIKKSERELRRANSDLAFLARHDSVTGLPNRRNFLARLSEAVEHANQYRGPEPAVMLLDLDRFKIVNDTLGHNIGDELLRLVGKRLEKTIRDVDTVARIGGDEFAVLLEETAGNDTVSSAAVRIIEALDEVFTVNNYTMRTGASIGIAFPSRGYTETELLRNADLAMYKAKRAGGGRFAFFDSEMHKHAIRKQQIERDIYEAVEKEAFTLYYQPICATASREPEAFEALIRWEHPTLGMVRPDEFIPMLEETGLISTVGRWVLQTACAQLAQWHKRNDRLRMCVNISPRQFENNNLASIIIGTAESAGIPPSTLEIEVTESMLMQNIDSAESTLQKVRDSGVRVAIDDFGTGYSQLVYLVRFPITTLKLDRSVTDTATTVEGDKLIEAVVGLAHRLEFEVIAEGVETPEQLALLSAMGCENYQGYLRARPMSAAQTTEWIKANASPAQKD